MADEVFLRDGLSEALERMLATPRRWLVTGCAGFIGSHLIEALLVRGHTVVGLDDFSTGPKENLTDVERRVGPEAWRRFRFVEGSVADPSACTLACQGVEVVLHQAALGSVPRSLQDPLATHHANATGTLTLLEAMRRLGVPRLVYASSSSVYGDHPALPKVESVIGAALSPYAVSKSVGERYAAVFARQFGLTTVGLRYFNVFGPRQRPDGPYAAVIPRWMLGALGRGPVQIFGDGSTTRDFCYISNVVEANLRAGLVSLAPTAAVLNVACGTRTSLRDLYAIIRDAATRLGVAGSAPEPEILPERPGDIAHSWADLSAAKQLIGFEPLVQVPEGIARTMTWFAGKYAAR